MRASMWYTRHALFRCMAGSRQAASTSKGGFVMPQLACPVCGATFFREPYFVRERNYCSRECRAIGRRKRVIQTCDTCGKTYERRPSTANLGKHTYCSHACRIEGHKRLNIVTCTICGKEMTRRDCELSRRPFCSKACLKVWRSEYRNTRSDVPCLQCGKTIRRKAHKLKDNKQQFCGRACLGRWRSENQAGANNPLWKGGYGTHYYGPNWPMQQRAARKRDGYKCRHCGKTAKQNKRTLDVHHIKPFCEFSYIPDQNETYLQANDLTNLITLCQVCHKRAEHHKIAIQPYLL